MANVQTKPLYLHVCLTSLAYVLTMRNVKGGELVATHTMNTCMTRCMQVRCLDGGGLGLSKDLKEKQVASPAKSL